MEITLRVAILMSSAVATRGLAGKIGVSSAKLQTIIGHASSYASANGIQIEKRDASGSSSFECAPISLFPNAYPRAAFSQANSLACPFNELVDRISRDGEFLENTLGGGVSDADPYTGKLLALYKEIYTGHGNKLPSWGKQAKLADRLGIQRSDYMLDTKEGSSKNRLKQVELNTIASSFAGLAATVASLHRHLVSRFRKDVKHFLRANKELVVGKEGTDNDHEPEGVPINPALTRLPFAMNVAHEQYKRRFGQKDSEQEVVILFVVQDGETNTVDQRMIEFRLWDNHQIPVVRMSLTKAHSDIELDEDNGALYVKSDGVQQEVSVAYFRAGYAPTDYPDGYDGIEWRSRERIERSRATKCPCLGYHLAGTKKVQQELARPGTLERFFPESKEKTMVQAMREAFAGLYSLADDGTDEDKDAVKDALSGNEGQYVLKPQREGGGYNIYGKDLARKLQDNVEEDDSLGLKLNQELAEFILMERLFPPKQTATLLRSGLVEGTGDSISELGCFGAVVATHDGELLHNEYAGFLLRTKFSNVDEGGVASGFATLSSPYLC